MRLYERQNCPQSDLYGSTQVESPICRVRSHICTQYRLGVRFARACHLALVELRNGREVKPVTKFLSFQNFGNFYISFFFFFLFLSKVQKVKYPPHLWSNHRNFLSETSNGNSLQVLKKINFDPTTWRTSRTTSRWRSTQKVRATQSFIKDKMTGRVDILWHIFEKLQKS